MRHRGLGFRLGSNHAADGDVAADGILNIIFTRDMDSRRALEGTADGDGHLARAGHVDAHLAVAAAGDACAGEDATVAANHRKGIKTVPANCSKGLWQRSHVHRGVHFWYVEPAERHVVGCLIGLGSRTAARGNVVHLYIGDLRVLSALHHEGVDVARGTVVLVDHIRVGSGGARRLCAHCRRAHIDVLLHLLRSTAVTYHLNLLHRAAELRKLEVGAALAKEEIAAVKPVAGSS